jgi:hypothetical protein
VSCLLIANMIPFINISKFFKCFFYIMTFRVAHWDTLDDSITIFVNLGFFWHFETVTNIRTWIISHKYWRML